MVATLTSQIAEFFEEGAEVVHQSLEKVMGRVEKVKQTVEGEEVFEIIRRRLFEDVGSEEDHRAVAGHAATICPVSWILAARSAAPGSTPTRYNHL